MIKKVWYSSLNNAIYDTKDEAQTAEDEYVANHFKELDRKAAVKRRQRIQLIQAHNLKFGKAFN